MAINESDKKLIESRNFNADVPVTTALDVLRQISKENLLLATGYIERHGGNRFSIAQISRDTGLHPRVCEHILSEHPEVTRVGNWHEQNAYLSTAPPLPESNNDDISMKVDPDRPFLGRGARWDWWTLVHTRSKSRKRKTQVIRHF